MQPERTTEGCTLPQRPKEIEDNKKNMANHVVPAGLASVALDSSKSGLAALIMDQEAAFIAGMQEDMNGVMGDSNCDNDATWTADKAKLGCTIPGTQYPRPGQLFPDEGQVPMPQGVYANAASPFGASVVAIFVVMAGVFATM